jgi:hypothetical protein
MTGMVFDQLRDFKLSIGDHHILHDPRVVNLAGYNKYLFHTIFNNNGAKSIQGGAEMNFAVMFDVGDTFSHPLPASFRQWKRTEQSTEIKQRWAKSSDHKVYVRDELIKAKANSNGASWFDVLFDIEKKLEQRLQVSRDKGLENDLHAVPDYATMENRTIGQGGILPASLFFHVNEDAFGMYGAYCDDAVGTAANSFAWNSAVAAANRPIKKQTFSMASTSTSTVVADTIIEPKYNIGGAQYSGATESKFSPVQRRYTSNKIDHPDNIFSMVRSAFRASSWEGPSDTKQWYENTEMNNFKLFTSDLGCRYMENMIKNGQDRWILGPQDMGVGEIQCFGIPIRWNPRLDKLAIYDYSSDGLSAPTGKGVEDLYVGSTKANGAGPRVYGFNFNSLYPVTHEGMWNYRETMPAHFNVPDVWVEYVEDWWQTACENYREQFVVSPSGNQLGLALLS